MFSPGQAYVFMLHIKRTVYAKDISNYEWHFWSTWFWHVLPWYCSHMLLGRLVDRFCCKYKEHFYLIHSLCALVHVMGPLSVGYLVIHCVIMYCVSQLRRTAACWSVSLVLLSALNISAFHDLQKAYMKFQSEEHFYQLLFTTAMMNLRYTSVSIEYSKRPQPTSRLKDMLSFFAYCFYLPLFFTGPLLTYDLYEIQMKQTARIWTKDKIFYIIREFMRVMFWATYLELILHFYHFNALIFDLYTVKSMGRWPLGGLGWSHGQFFHVKYVVMFGLPGTVAKVDGLDPPHQPKCISRIHLYSDMWKYFDRGLYSYLKRYIYIPVGGAPDRYLNKFLASAMCFLYIYYWHGMYDYLVVWCSLNFIGVSVEAIANLICSSASGKRLKEYVSAAMWRRMKAAINAPLLAICIMSNFYFFMGNEVGQVFFHKLVLYGTLPSYAVVLYSMYCLGQSSMESERWEDAVCWWDSDKRHLLSSTSADMDGKHCPSKSESKRQ
ncbi:PREDICTED: protein-cysteine N-palmitoyltransferase HHAT-like isoform X2 [Priapulus caudatus]|uniref:Protein-cysteine N-palmitoyltransferase HHAT-like isoform X2 n=1 Tax=Priapulus caudatus TaxID=37621 RepID=A0ABM1EJZ8_PRICU|nr:PREDICTED: protein-cysteine N-palmitoyltransferase HHAT-like isoform X2 [Priapulus caudatus]